MARVRTELIRDELTKRGWKVPRLARRADLADLTVSKILDGSTRDPGLKTIEAIARALDLKTVDLITDDEPLPAVQLAAS